jgi:hypothetical protein
LPFLYTLYDQAFTQVVLDSNGKAHFPTGTAVFTNTCLPQAGATYTIYPYWDDQRTDVATCTGGCGIFTLVSGTAPNRIFNIEWRTAYFSGGGNANYELRLYEGAPSRFEIIYGVMTQGNTSATSGAQRDATTFVQDFCNGVGTAATGSRTYTLQGAGCPTNTPTPSITATATVVGCPIGNYVVAQGAATIVPGTTNIGSNCDDCVINVTLPFLYTLYDQAFTQVVLDSNGKAHFPTGSAVFTNTCLPQAGATYTIYPYWDDQRTDLTTCTGGCGIFTSISGIAPNRIFNIEWRTAYFSGTGNANYELRLYEGAPSRFDIVYGTVAQGNTSATSGAQRDATIFVQDFCNGVGTAATGSRTYTLQGAGCPTNTRTPTRTITSTPTRTPTPGRLIVGHITWQGIAQPAPASSGPITLTVKSGATEVNFTSTTDNSGFFTVTTSLADGNYNWRVKGPKNLANCGALVLAGNVTNQEMGTLRAGDANNDNLAQILDFNILKVTFGRGLGDPGYDARADFNNDNLANVTDFTLLKTNFGSGGCGPVLGPSRVTTRP